ncbi:MAG: NDP-sugar synthase [Solirubrobacterales bacterium]|nr:NDP-sugar synthase [Solirubrobacterales bacterium]
MQALILVGGHGTRLRPVTLTLPKPVIPLVDRPFLRYMIDWLARHGVDDVVMACGFLPDQLRAAFGDEIPGGPTLHYVEEPEPRGTAGAIKFAEDLLQDRFFALNGDSLTDLDLTALLDRHVSSGARATLGVHPVDDITGLGLVRSDPDTGEILEFLEKPDPATVDTNEVSAGMYVLEKEVLDLVPPHQDVSIEREVWPRLVGDGLYSQRLEGYWMDIGTPDRYLAACWDILGRKVESEPGDKVDDEGRYVAADADVDPGAAVEGQAFVESDCAVAAEATIGPRAVLGAGVSVGKGASIVGSALHPACRVGSGAAVVGSILSAGVVVEDGANVPEGSVIGAGATITAQAELEPNARVQPEETV